MDLSRTKRELRQRGVFVIQKDDTQLTLRTAKGTFAIEEGPTSFSFTRIDGEDEVPLTLEIALPDVSGSRLPGTGHIAVAEVRGEHGRSAIVLHWGEGMSFVSDDVRSERDFLALRVLDIDAPRATVVAETLSEKAVFLVDRARDAVKGEGSESLLRPGQEVLRHFEPFEELLQELGNPSTVTAKPSEEEAKQKCKKDRARGWIKVVAGVLAAGVGLMTLGVGLAVIGAIGVGAAGGGQQHRRLKTTTRSARRRPRRGRSHRSKTSRFAPAVA